MTTEKKHLRNMSLPELEALICSFGQPPYRFRQVASWLYTRMAYDFSMMTDLSKTLRGALASVAVINSIEQVSSQISTADGTRKFLFRLSDGELIESVFMRQDGRITLCISTQVGCPLDCIFCQTGQGEYRRNLTSGEMLDQICMLKAECLGETEKVNIVFMGMGEPLLNYKEVVKAIRVINDPLGLSTGSRRITVSTAGIPQNIRSLADEGLKCSLAVSLNAPDDAKRKTLMPALSRYSIKDILDAARYFFKKTRRRVTLEYVLLSGINTSRSDAIALGRLTRQGPFKINLIPCNPVEDGLEVSEEVIDSFVAALLPLAPAVTVRRSKGADIKAACGQLWTESLKKRKTAKDTLHTLGEGHAGKGALRRRKGRCR